MLNKDNRLDEMVKPQSLTGFRGDSTCIQGEGRVDPTPGLGKETIFPLYYNPHSKSGSRVISLKCHYGHLTKIISTSLYVLIYTTNTLYILYIRYAI